MAFFLIRLTKTEKKNPSNILFCDKFAFRFDSSIQIKQCALKSRLKKLFVNISFKISELLTEFQVILFRCLRFHAN